MQSIIRQFDRDKINILTFSTHERTQSNMSDIDANFYLCKTNQIQKDWNNKFAKLPDNHYICLDGYIPYGIQFDFVLSQNKFGQFSVAYEIARNLNIPLIALEHTWPTSNIPQDNIQRMKEMVGDINIFIGKNQAKAWGAKNPIIIGHCVDNKLFNNSTQNRNNHILTVCNDYINRDYVLGYSQYKRVTSGLPTLPIGDTPGLSEAANSTEELVKIYQSSKIFLNTSIESPIPTVLLEAMSCGLAVVSTNNCDIPNYIDHGINGFLANNDTEMRTYLEMLLNDDDLATMMGTNAAITIQQKCSKVAFTEKWNNILRGYHESQINN